MQLKILEASTIIIMEVMMRRRGNKNGQWSMVNGQFSMNKIPMEF